MPRVDGTYTAPHPDVVPDTTIESAVYNNTIHDLVYDANYPRPITAGGTSAVSAAVARTNLHAEVAAEEVTNYDTHTWAAGSFWSNTTATNPPVAAHLFTGLCVMAGVNPAYITLVARDHTTGLAYYRVRSASVWGPWTLDADDKVSIAGDTMTGDLTIVKASPNFVLNKAASGQHAQLIGQKGGQHRWSVNAGDDATESGGNSGSNFRISRFIDAGTYLDDPLTINRATGNATFQHQVFSAGFNIIASTNFGIYEAASVRYCQFNINQHLALNPGDNHLYCRNGTDVWRAQADGNFLCLTTAYKPGGGPWLDPSDVRIKNVLGDYQSGLEAIIALQPVRYTFKGNDTDAATPDGDSPHRQAAESQKEFIGLIAQEVETVMPEMVSQQTAAISGVAVNDLRVLDTGPLLFALVNAIKELAARLDALEARAPP